MKTNKSKTGGNPIAKSDKGSDACDKGFSGNRASLGHDKGFGG